VSETGGGVMSRSAGWMAVSVVMCGRML